MRRILLATCAVALVACSDSSSNPAATAPVHFNPGLLSLDSSARTGGRVDPRSIPDRVAELVGARFQRVILPPDNFSLSSDAVHPDVACRDRDWNGMRCWLMYTPYKGSEISYENPGFLFASTDTTWHTPPAVSNPIVPYPGFGAYNSDPDHAFDPGNNRLTQVYRVVADTFNKIMIMSTADAKTWTTARVAFRERSHDAISPSLVIDDDRSANLWYVRSGLEGCSSTGTTVALRTAMPTPQQTLEQAPWSPATVVNFSIPNAVIWHLDVAPLPGEGYVALVVAYPKTWSCGLSDLYLATSPDGLTWRTFAMPLLWRGMPLARARSIATWYRGTLRYDAATDSLHVWPSALAGASWTIYHTAFKLHDMLGLMASAQPSDIKTIAYSQSGIRPTLAMP